jgi:hypothetical protein
MRNNNLITISVMAAVFLLLACGSANAQYTGQTIDGTLAFGPNGATGGNFWSSDTITAPGTFYYQDDANIDTVAFTDNTLTVTDMVLQGASGWEMQFSDTALPFTDLTLVSDNFSPDITYSLSGGVITLDWTGTEAGARTDTATFDLASSSAVPEPSSLALLGTGIAAFGELLRRRRA